MQFLSTHVEMRCSEWGGVPPFLLLLRAQLALLVIWSGPHSVGGSEEQTCKHKAHENAFSLGCRRLTWNWICVGSHFLVALGGFFGELGGATVKSEGKKKDGWNKLSLVRLFTYSAERISHPEVLDVVAGLSSLVKMPLKEKDKVKLDTSRCSYLSFCW